LLFGSFMLLKDGQSQACYVGVVAVDEFVRSKHWPVVALAVGLVQQQLHHAVERRRVWLSSGETPELGERW
jgi:hypothetical protein